MRHIGRLIDFQEQAFEDIYRIPWNEAAPILAEYIYQME
jgi:hypothetical protein